MTMGKNVVLESLTGLFLCSNIWGQTIIDIADNTLKVAAISEEVFYFGFAEGDQVIFNFQEVNGKELKEIEIVELPSSSKFMDYKSSKIENKTFNILKTGIYKFRFSNQALSGRICKFKIQRIPASETTKNFNTNVYTRTVYDTTYTPITEKYLIKSDTAAIPVVDQVARVSSQTAMNGSSNKTIVDFTLPEGTIAWSYYIGVGNEGEEAFKAASDKFLTSAADAVISIPGYGTMAALALYGINYFTQIQGGDNIKYYFITDWENVLLFKSGQAFYQYKQGDVVNDASRMTTHLTGKIYLALINDNIADAIDVTVKVTAVNVKQEWGTKIVQEMNITSREELYLIN
jgi:hypothetical protein